MKMILKNQSLRDLQSSYRSLQGFLFIEQILVYLEVSTICQLSFLNKEFFDLLKCDNFWNFLCEEVYGEVLAKQNKKYQTLKKYWESWSSYDYLLSLQWSGKGHLVRFSFLLHMEISFMELNTLMIDKMQKNREKGFLLGTEGELKSFSITSDDFGCNLNDLILLKDYKIQQKTIVFGDYMCLLDGETMAISLYNMNLNWKKLEISFSHQENNIPILPLFDFSFDYIKEFPCAEKKTFQFLLFGGENGAEMEEDYCVFQHTYTALITIHSSSCAEITWKKEQVYGDIPSGRSSHSSVVSRNTLFIFGGICDRNHNILSNELFLLDLNTMIFSKHPFLPPDLHPRYQAGLCVSLHLIIIFGGKNNDILLSGKSLARQFYVFDMITEEWFMPWLEGSVLFGHKQSNTTLIATSNSNLVVFFVDWGCQIIQQIHIDKY